MRAFAFLFDPLRQAFAAFFRQDLALRRVEDGLRIVLEDRPPGPGKTARARPASRPELAAKREAYELALIQSQLAELLGELSETRQTLRHLVAVEQALAKKGLRALHKLPLDVLQRGLDQLEGLVTNWSPAGLASLRSKMAVAIAEREPAGAVVAGADGAPAEARLQEPSSRAEIDAAADARSEEDEALAAAYAALGTVAPDLAADLRQC